jgi:signal peptidase I
MKMKMVEMNTGRKTLLAVFLGLTMPGLGQTYNGELVKGTSSFIIALALLIIGFRLTVLLPDGMLMIGVIATFLAVLVMYAASIVDAYRTASGSDAAYPLKSYNRWYFYLAIWLLSFMIGFATLGYARDHWIEAFWIPTSSMEPAVSKGDHVLADKTAYQRMSPQKGDIVIFIYPDDRSKKYIKRIEALPGDPYPDAYNMLVPHGFAYVMGDNKEHSQDSRKFGLIPLRDIIGKVRQKY